MPDFLGLHAKIYFVWSGTKASNKYTDKLKNKYGENAR